MKRPDLKYLLLITVIFTASCIETDMYLPAFTDMMHFFSVSESRIQSLLTWNFFGICISGPLYGPISDAIGRKKPLLIALGFFLIGSLITTVSSSFPWMLWGRLLQGLGSGGCFTLGTAIIFDVFHQQKAIKALNQLNLIIPFIMSLAPMVGGFLNHMYGFRSNFLLITLSVVLSLIMSLFFLEETLPQENKRPFTAKKLAYDCSRALRSTPFWQITLTESFLFSGYMVFLSGSSVVFITELGISKTWFPLYQASILVAWLIASLTLIRILEKWGTDKIKRIGKQLTFASTLGAALVACMMPHSALALTCVMLVYSFGINWVMAMYFPEGMEILPDIKGITASLITSARLLISSVIVGLASYYYNGTIYPMTIALVACSLAIFPLLMSYEKRKRATQSIATSSPSHE